jgi:hypothetical protein
MRPAISDDEMQLLLPLVHLAAGIALLSFSPNERHGK